MRDIAALDWWNQWAGDPKAARNLIAKLYCALSEAPQTLRINRVDLYDEADLDANVQQIGKGLDESDGAFWPDFKSISESEVFDSAFLAMRMLDEALSQQVTVCTTETLAEFETDAGYFVVPCRKVAGSRAELRGQGLSRRGLLYHRIAPTQYDGVRLTLHVHPDVGLKPDQLPPSRTVGAAIFSGLKLQQQSSEKFGAGNFVVTGLTCDPAQDQALINQCKSAVAGRCDTLIWPELTMPPERLEQVRELLVTTPLSGDRPPVVVAGSWHVQCNPGIRNRSEVLDGRGERIFSFDKCLTYFKRGVADGPGEDIEHGDSVHLLLAEDELIIFMICLDFCHVDRDALLKACDATLAIVPSMGAESTIRDHLTRAAALQTSNNTRTVVVQQHPDPTAGSALGYILPGAKRPQGIAMDKILAQELFTLFYTEGQEVSGG